MFSHVGIMPAACNTGCSNPVSLKQEMGSRLLQETGGWKKCWWLRHSPSNPSVPQLHSQWTWTQMPGDVGFPFASCPFVYLVWFTFLLLLQIKQRSKGAWGTHLLTQVLVVRSLSLWKINPRWSGSWVDSMWWYGDLKFPTFNPDSRAMSRPWWRSS